MTTNYLVLKANDDSDWTEGQLVEAASASAAIRTVAEKQGAGQYVAVPDRSWNPCAVTIETKTKVKLS
jgi:hypothetical protein